MGATLENATVILKTGYCDYMYPILLIYCAHETPKIINSATANLQTNNSMAAPPKLMAKQTPHHPKHSPQTTSYAYIPHIQLDLPPST